jgi:leucyl-tRNA synthetase
MARVGASPAPTINPLNGARVPVYVADHVLMSHGSGAIMGVPAHDQRDFEFAARHNVPVRMVVEPPGRGEAALEAAYTGTGVMVNAGEWDGLPSEVAAEGITAWLVERGIGTQSVQYKMRDWLISRRATGARPSP